MISDYTKERIRKLRTEDKLSISMIAKKLKLTKGQVAGFCDREEIPVPDPGPIEHALVSQKIKAKNIKNPMKWLQSFSESRLDRSRITLINIPSIAEAQAQTVYSYIARDQSSGTKKTDRRSLDE